MKRTLMMSVAAFALAAGTTVALSQGGGAGGNTPMATPSAPSGGQDTHATKPKADKQKSTQQQPVTRSGGTSGQAQEDKASPSTTKQSQDKNGQPSTKQSQDKSGQPSTKQSQDTKSKQP